MTTKLGSLAFSATQTLQTLQSVVQLHVKNAWTLHNPNLTNPTVSCSTARKHEWIHCNRDSTNPTVGCSITRKNARIHTNMLTNLMFNSM